MSELRRLRTSGSEFFLLLLHLLELRHFYKDLMDFVVTETLENVVAFSMVELLLSDSVFLEILKISDTVSLVFNILV